MQALQRLLLSMCSGVLAAAPVLALAFPDKPVQLIVPYAAGGLTDNLARVIAPALSARWGQPVVIET
ncbi:tripartite-type tricarboxylate transporter receptor subunit TctC [Variovorax paradoxus]|uniref:hypothetical protein n=1 Tax=Variovorax paradoxus TaxID=34073 RepID=UPI00278B5465|nr:hypothetical protein [Variovorax paradoxus]MDQ0027484.1 tripartite-type tricarboxylate transporter receptor subunit TctC [Variovorax paradoxus]